jgi:hypothetical protein
VSPPETKKSPPKGRRVASGDTLPFGKRNQILFATGLGVILLGYVLLSKNDTTLAPLLLVIGYCVLIPLAIMAK